MTTGRSAGFLLTCLVLGATACSDAARSSAPQATDPSVTPPVAADLGVPKSGTQILDVCPAAKGEMRCHAKVVKHIGGVLMPFAGPVGYTPANLIAAYGIVTSGTSAVPPIVAIVDAQDDPNAEADLTFYRNYFGLPACTTANGCFKKLDENGGTNYPTSDSGWAGEISLDLDMVSAACPSCKIILLEANSGYTSDLGTAVNTAVRLGASVVSNSYGGPEDDTNSTVDTEYYSHPGVTIFASAGDDGYEVQYPAAGAWVIGVGGTSLTKSGSVYSEKIWYNGAGDGTGSGCSQFTPQPSWQSTAPTGCTGKLVADVSACADPNHGVAVYQTYGGTGWEEYGGTSVASPLVAAIFAASNLGGVSPDFVWSNTSFFKDVPVGSGSNTTPASSCSPVFLCTTETGYDGPTGWGSPIGASLATTTERRAPWTRR